jgi:group I intron endonuclease
MKSGIYKISFDGNRLFYIGSSVNLVARKTNHISDLKNNNHCNQKLQNAYNKYKKFCFEVIENCSIEELIVKEQYYLDNLKPNLNILKVAFSSIGFKHTEETIKKITIDAQRKAKDKNWIDKVSKGWFKKGEKVKFSKKAIDKRVKAYTGYKHTDEAKKKMSEKAKQRDWTKIDKTKFNKSGVEASKKPIKQIKQNGEIIIFESITEAIKQFNTKQTRHLVSAAKSGKMYKKCNWLFCENLVKNS